MALLESSTLGVANWDLAVFRFQNVILEDSSDAFCTDVLQA